MSHRKFRNTIARHIEALRAAKKSHTEVFIRRANRDAQWSATLTRLATDCALASGDESRDPRADLRSLAVELLKMSQVARQDPASDVRLPSLDKSIALFEKALTLLLVDRPPSEARCQSAIALVKRALAERDPRTVADIKADLAALEKDLGP